MKWKGKENQWKMCLEWMNERTSRIVWRMVLISLYLLLYNWKQIPRWEELGNELAHPRCNRRALWLDRHYRDVDLDRFHTPEEWICGIMNKALQWGFETRINTWQFRQCMSTQVQKTSVWIFLREILHLILSRNRNTFFAQQISPVWIFSTLYTRE